MGENLTPLSFDKYEGLGNDFIVVDAREDGEVTPELATRLCDRRFGIGADGVLVVLPARAPGCEVRMRLINADGSVPEMCGNGVRCIALRHARARGMARGTVHVDTDAGPRTCDVEDGPEPLVTVDMGVVRVLGDRAVDVGGRTVVPTLADAGNPHAVLLGTFGRGDVEHLGPRLATHALFPRGTNVEFACAMSDGIDLVVWERGVGITLACGTGACATVAVACEKGLVPRGKAVRVRLPGGPLDVTIDESGRATMRGPARHVYSGTWSGV
ncbi:MAG TPA: diaminopimelate epimerase [Polyangiaceae bacterium]